MSPLFICACNKFELSVAWRSPTGVKLWVATADFCLVCLLLLYFYFTLYIFILLHIICTAFLLPEEGVYSVDPARFSAPFTKNSLAVSHWTLRMEMFGCQSRRLNQNKPFSRPVSTLMSSSVQLCSFSLSGRLSAVGLNALTHLSLISISGLSPTVRKWPDKLYNNDENDNFTVNV